MTIEDVRSVVSSELRPLSDKVTRLCRTIHGDELIPGDRGMAGAVRDISRTIDGDQNNREDCGLCGDVRELKAINQARKTSEGRLIKWGLTLIGFAVIAICGSIWNSLDVRLSERAMPTAIQVNQAPEAPKVK